ncbi:hypothetical protein LV716_18325 [Flagellimonas sp. HMM57]|uniref:hypothetical protein n=1 Tax=unclassified Flagellimonas TaxID=2644544 RepID=UPI0013D59639|nr:MULTISPECIES: hypothetical protein [unclassified Flagellimonas]UII76196.1 hypothetical protein LV716_18325 [Flagellimonas sp. HMM57]
MANKTYRTCLKCGTVNLNKDYCEECGELINIVLKRKLDREVKDKQKIDLEKTKKKNGITIFFERAKDHDNLLIRFIALFLYSIWIIVLAIGSFLAFLFGYIAA